MKLSDEQLSLLEGSLWKSPSGELFICFNVEWVGRWIESDYHLWLNNDTTEQARCSISYMITSNVAAECIAPQAAIDLVVAERNRYAKTQ